MKSTIVLSLIIAATCATPAFAKKGKATKATFAERDTDQDGKISEAEFVTAKKAKGKTAQKAAFATKDVDKDGFLSETEY